MHPRSMLAGIVAFLLLGMLRPHPVSACSCSRSAAPCEASWSADAVFVGQVVEFEPLSQPDDDTLGPFAATTSIRMRVLERFRGNVRDEAEIHTSGGTCGYGFLLGSTYLIYAN